MNDSRTTVQKRNLFRNFLNHLGSPYAIGLSKELENGRDNDVFFTSAPMPDPRQYVLACDFSRDYLAYNLLRKCTWLETGINKRAAALAAFTSSEEICSVTNRYRGKRPDLVASTSVAHNEAILHTASLKISKLLGDFSWDTIQHLAAFSGGASTRLRRGFSHPMNKLCGKPHVTRRAALFGMCTVWHYAEWSKSQRAAIGNDPFDWIEPVAGARLSFVPKDSKTDRTICVEPELNMFIQKGFGSYIRSRLKRVGIDLNDQTVNQDLAMHASKTGTLATIDLSAASDSIASSLVESLLPPVWYAAMDLVRSDTVILDGTHIPLSKFSSMGNGFTFELESLIFWAITSATCELSEKQGAGLMNVSVYGDDIICPAIYATELESALTYAGFTINALKSYWSGPFRESCGKHYFNGTDVTPFFVKEFCISNPKHLYLLANNMRFWSLLNLDTALQNPFRQVLNLIRQLDVLRFCPANVGNDIALVAPFDEACPRLQVKSRKLKTPFYFGYEYKGYVLEPKSRRRLEFKAYLHTLCVGRDDKPFPENPAFCTVGEVLSLETFYTSVWDAPHFMLTL